jgi:hypothetical protein
LTPRTTKGRKEGRGGRRKGGKERGRESRREGGKKGKGRKKYTKNERKFDATKNIVIKKQKSYQTHRKQIDKWKK